MPPEIRRESEEAALAVLTPEQKEKWQAQLGKLFDFPPPEFGPGFGPPGGPGGPFGGPGGPNREERRILKQFDTNHDGWLNQAERVPARQFAKEEARNAPRGRRGGFGGPPGGPGGPPGGPGGRGPGGRRGGRGPGRDVPPPSPGPPVSPQDVVSSNAPLYEPTVLRTLFLEFENSDWEAELADFHGTDVDVPAKLTVDGKTYPHVGVHFRGMSSYMMVPAGSKRSLNLSLDLADKKQRLDGYKTMNLLNAHEDDSFMSSVLYSHIARQYMPAPRANLVRVVINGESWGVYANVQQFDKEFLKQNYHSTQGTRWKVSGSPGGGGGLDYLGDEIEPYRRRYEIKSDDDDAAWQKLINLCRVLDKTPAAQLEAALEPILDVDELLWFLALDNTLINCDGYWIRASDYSLYLDGDGKFHVVPHDMNEAFRPPMGPGMGGRGGRGGRFGFPGGPPPGGENAGPPPREAAPGGRRPARVDLDPLVGMDDARKPLRSKVLGIPAWRTRYLQNVRTIAEKSLDWNTLGPVVAQYRELVGLEIERDTRKLSTYEDFQRATSDEPPSSDHANPPDAEQPPRFGPATMNLRTFAEKRREYLLSLPSIRELAP